jgi:hypothetical protein
MILVAIATISCSKGGDGIEYPDPTPPEKPSMHPEVKIATADNGKSNIFEIMQFDISIEGLESNPNEMIFGGFVLSDHYDSLVWRIPNRGLRFKLFECDESSHQFAFSFGHNFFTPGKIDSRLSGYKEGKEIFSYDYPVKVNNNKDFLGFNWTHITQDSEISTGYTDVFTKDRDWGFTTSHEIHDGVPSISLRITTMQDTKDFQETKKRELLFNLIDDIYGEPDYGDADEKTDIATTEKCNTIFHFVEDDSQPLSIWITEKSKIVLLRGNDGGHVIYAEPY